jgi:hypothetical protein
MKRYSTCELFKVIKQLKSLVDVVKFQRAFISISCFYSPFECQDIGVQIDLRIIELNKSHGR